MSDDNVIPQEDELEPNFEQCVTCVSYEQDCRPTLPHDGITECDNREIDPKRWEEFYGEKWES